MTYTLQGDILTPEIYQAIQNKHLAKWIELGL